MPSLVRLGLMPRSWTCRHRLPSLFFLPVPSSGASSLVALSRSRSPAPLAKRAPRWFCQRRGSIALDSGIGAVCGLAAKNSPTASPPSTHGGVAVRRHGPTTRVAPVYLHGGAPPVCPSRSLWPTPSGPLGAPMLTGVFRKASAVLTSAAEPSASIFSQPSIESSVTPRQQGERRRHKSRRHSKRSRGTSDTVAMQSQARLPLPLVVPPGSWPQPRGVGH